MALDREQAEQDAGRNGNNVGLEHRRRDLQPLDRAQDGNGRRDHGVAEKQRRSGEADHEQGALQPPGDRQSEGEQRHGAAFALVVGTHDEDDILDGDDQHDGPEHQRQDAEHGRLNRRSPAALSDLRGSVGGS